MADYTARMPRTPHPIGKKHAFTTAPGMIRCPYWTPVHAGDTLHFNGSVFVRFNPLITPFIGSCKVYVDYFYVPLTVLYSPSSSMFYQTDDLVSSVFEGSKSNLNHFPLLNVTDSLLEINDNGNFSAGQPWLSSSTRRLNPDVFDCYGKAAVRICEDFKFNPVSVVSGDTGRNFNVFPYALAAYHAVYELHDRYRNNDREAKSYIYNFDKYFANDGAVTESKLFTLHYVDAQADYFNDIKVSPVGASMSMLNGSSSWDMLSKVNSYLFDNATYERVNHQGYSNPKTGPQRFDDNDLTTLGRSAPYGSTSMYELSNQFNAANIRQLFMVDKLLRIVGRADKNYESQFLAHFGVKIPHDVMHNITHLGQDVAVLSPEPILSTANTWNGTTGSALGEVGGQGYVRQAFKPRHFDVPFHGVFLACMYIVPQMRYQTIHSRLHTLNTPMDWWQPEYDRKGMEPLFGYEAANRFSLPTSGLQNRLGWIFGYEYFKRRYDDVGFAFWTPESYGTTVNNYAPWVLSKKPFSTVAPSSDAQISFDVQNDWSAFKSMPTDLNGVMQVPYSPNWIDDLSIENLHSLFYTDPFICDFGMNMVDVNFMSENSEPILNN